MRVDVGEMSYCKGSLLGSGMMILGPTFAHKSEFPLWGGGVESVACGVVVATGSCGKTVDSFAGSVLSPKTVPSPLVTDERHLFEVFVRVWGVRVVITY